MLEIDSAPANLFLLGQVSRVRLDNIQQDRYFTAFLLRVLALSMFRESLAAMRARRSRIDAHTSV